MPLKTDEQIAEEQEQPKPVKKEKTRKVIKPKLSTEFLTEKVTVSEKAEEAIAPVVKSREKMKERRKGGILTKVCSIEVCPPEICCADMEGELSGSEF